MVGRYISFEKLFYFIYFLLCLSILSLSPIFFLFSDICLIVLDQFFNLLYHFGNEKIAKKNNMNKKRENRLYQRQKTRPRGITISTRLFLSLSLSSKHYIPSSTLHLFNLKAFFSGSMSQDIRPLIRACSYR